jgi:acetyltransferase-like isoleucine patch superfamily enzyme
MPASIDYELKAPADREVIHERIFLAPGAKTYKTTFGGPCFIDRNCKIGPNVTIGRYTGFHDGTYASRCTIGAFCSFGSRNSINPFNHPTSWLSTHEFQYPNLSFFWDEDFQKLSRIPRDDFMVRPANIGNDVWTGDGVSILNGVSVGDGAVIGTGAIVTKNVEPYAIVAGNPAKLIRYRFTPDIIERLLKVKWWNMELRQLSGLPFNNVEACLNELERMRGQCVY